MNVTDGQNSTVISHQRTNAFATVVLALVAWISLLPGTAQAQVGTCEPAAAEAYLDVNNVRARILGNGALFYRGEPHVYEVPQGSGLTSLFSASLWLGGLVSGELRMAAARYGPWEFWPGPLDDDGGPPPDCAPYDRLWKVSRADVAAYDDGEDPTPDLRDWPTGLGAPTVDSSGVDIDILGQPLAQRVGRVIDLDAGERPKFTGDQMIWWIMNDRGGSHRSTDTEPMGVEVHGTAFAFVAGSEDVGNTTLYRFRIRYFGTAPIDSTFIGAWFDADLGDFQDDYVGMDTTLGMAYTYNSDDFDGTARGYGAAPPAIGFDFVRGPTIRSPADTAWIAGSRVAGLRHLRATAMLNSINNQDPGTGSEYYNHMRGRYKFGDPITERGYGHHTDGPGISFHFPGDPVAQTFWSENNNDGAGGTNIAFDRHFSTSSGPFQMERGGEQEVTFAVLWARGNSNLDSITRLREASRTIQEIVDANYDIPSFPPDPPAVEATPSNNQVVLTWTNDQGSNNYSDTYKQHDAFVEDTYEFEGYNVVQYASENDDSGRIIAVYDIANGIQQVIDGPMHHEQRIVANGTDAGIRHFHIVDGLTNYDTYHFGVQAYAYQGNAYPRVRTSNVARVSATPYLAGVAAADSALAAWRSVDAPDIVIETQSPGEISIAVDIVNPYQVRGGLYALRPDSASCSEGKFLCRELQVLRGDGNEAAKLILTGETDHPATSVFDGLSMSVEVRTASVFRNFTAISNSAGPIDPPEYAAFAFNSSGFPQPGGSDRPDISRQQTNGSAWGVHSLGSSPLFGSIGDDGTFLDIVTQQGALRVNVGASDFEIRFTSSGGQAWLHRDGGGFMNVPFELWNIGPGTPDDPSDDYRMIPAVCEAACGHAGQPGVFDISGDHPISGGTDDPFTDAFSWLEPMDTSPGQGGYDAFFSGGAAGSGQPGVEVMRNMVLVSWNGGDAPPYAAALPETGTTFRIETAKGLRVGSEYTLDTRPFGARQPTDVDRAAALRDIGIVPNPYRGVSAYQTSLTEAEVRFTNVPAGATVRVFTLNGSLVRTLAQLSDGVLRWDLRNEAGRYLAPGMYLVHIDVTDVGTRVLKFGVQRLAFGDD